MMQHLGDNSGNKSSIPVGDGPVTITCSNKNNRKTVSKQKENGQLAWPGQASSNRKTKCNCLQWLRLQTRIL